MRLERRAGIRSLLGGEVGVLAPLLNGLDHAVHVAPGDADARVDVADEPRLVAAGCGDAEDGRARRQRGVELARDADAPEALADGDDVDGFLPSPR